MRLKVEIHQFGVDDALINNEARVAISVLISLRSGERREMLRCTIEVMVYNSPVRREETDVVPRWGNQKQHASENRDYSYLFPTTINTKLGFGLKTCSIAGMTQ